MTTVIQQLAQLGAGPVPADVRQGIPSRLVDIVGIAVRATQLDTSQAALGFISDQASGPQATAVGSSIKVAAPEAAFANGVLAHSLDYDDTHLPSILHPSASVVPAAMATAELVNASGSDLVDAIAIGLEIAVRLGMGGFDETARQSIYFERGQHATSICGAIGSAAAAARLLNGSAELIGHAMGIACSMGSGIIEANRSGGTVKRMHCGWAARAGVTAAQLAARGITGPPTAIEGRFGFFQAYLGDLGDVDATLRDLGRDWQAASIFYKPYPANHFTHTSIDAALDLRAEGLRAEHVAHAVLRVAPPTVRTIGDPIESKRLPETGYQAQFSGPFTVSAALLAGSGLGLGLSDFTDERAVDPAHRALMQRIDVEADPSLLDIYPYQFPCRLTVETTDGNVLTREVLANRGGTERPLTEQELATKFSDNVEGLVPIVARDRFTEQANMLDDVDNITDLLAPFQGIAQP